VPDVTMQASVHTIPPQAANSGVQEHMTERVDVGWSVRGVPLGRIPRRPMGSAGGGRNGHGRAGREAQSRHGVPTCLWVSRTSPCNHRGERLTIRGLVGATASMGDLVAGREVGRRGRVTRLGADQRGDCDLAGCSRTDWLLLCAARN
jgi:hypothetical protein